MTAPRVNLLPHRAAKRERHKKLFWALTALSAVAGREEAMRRDAAESDDDKPRQGDGISLRQRAWPLVEMMKRAHAAGENIVWGV